MSDIDADTHIKYVVAGTVLVSPAGVEIPLAHAVWLVFPCFVQLTLLDGFVLSSSISLLRHRYKRGIDNLSTTGFQLLGS